MNKKMLAAGFLSAIAISTLTLTSTVSAFWPFDQLFGKGEVKALTSGAKPAQITGFRAPVVETSKEVMALREACKNITSISSIRMDDSRRYIAKDDGREGKIQEVFSPGMSNVKDVTLDPTMEKSFMSVQKQLIIKCNEILSITTKMDPIINRVEKERGTIMIEPVVLSTPTPTPTAATIRKIIENKVEGKFKPNSKQNGKDK